MVNAWSFLSHEIDGTLDDEYPIMKEKNDSISFSVSTEEHDKSYYDFDRNKPPVYPEDHPSQQFWHEDGFSLTGNPGAMAPDTIRFGDDPYPTIGSSITGSRVQGGMGEDHISLRKPEPNLKYQQQKYGEDKGIADLKDYVSSTYQGHYTNDNSDVQTLDLIHSVGDAESFCRSNALKYLSRYDKKGSAKRDILKAMHYCLLLYYFSGNTNETSTRGYETF